MTQFLTAQAPARQLRIIARDWRPYEKNSLQGFVTLELPSGLIIADCAYHKRDLSEWIGLPGKPQIENGQQRKDQRGKALYLKVLDFTTREAAHRFQTEALAAVHALIDGAAR